MAVPSHSTLYRTNVQRGWMDGYGWRRRRPEPEPSPAEEEQEERHSNHLFVQVWNKSMRSVFFFSITITIISSSPVSTAYRSTCRLRLQCTAEWSGTSSFSAVCRRWRWRCSGCSFVGLLWVQFQQQQRSILQIMRINRISHSYHSLQSIQSL